MAIATIPKRNTRTLIIVHNVELMNQWKDQLKKFLGINCGLIGNGKYDIKDITVGIINSVHKKVEDFQSHFGYVIYDECFVAGTKVDGKPIETLQIGDYVKSYNHETKTIEFRKILNVFKNKVKDDLLQINANGAKIVSTKTHPYYCENKYLPADQLNVNSTVHGIVESQLNGVDYGNNRKMSRMRKNNRNRTNTMENYAAVLQRMQNRKKIKKQEKSNSSLQGVWEFSNRYSMDNKKRDLLLTKMHRFIRSKCTDEIRRISFQIQQSTRKEKDVRKEPNAQPYGSRKNENYKTNQRHIKCVGLGKRGQWEINTATGKISDCSGMGYRSCRKYVAFTLQTGRKISKQLQNRCSKPCFENWNRNRWKRTQKSAQENLRFEKRKSLDRFRVEDIKIHKRANRQEFEKVCPDGYVYNIEVEGNNNYFVEGVLVHNCHRTMGSTWLDVINSIVPKYHLGVTATPFRNDETTKALFSVIGPKLHVVDRGELEETGAIAIPRIVRLRSDSYIPWDTSTYQYSDFVSHIATDVVRNAMIAKAVVQEYNTYKDPILVVSDRVEHCEMLTELINSYENMNVLLLHGKVKKSERKTKVDKFKKGHYNVLVATVSLIGEGFDSPSLGAIFLTTPIKFTGRVVQSVGRITRPSGDEKPRVYDVRDTMIDIFKYSGFARDRLYKSLGWDE